MYFNTCPRFCWPGNEDAAGPASCRLHAPQTGVRRRVTTVIAASMRLRRAACRPCKTLSGRSMHSYCWSCHARDVQRSGRWFRLPRDQGHGASQAISSVCDTSSGSVGSSPPAATTPTAITPITPRHYLSAKAMLANKLNALKRSLLAGNLSQEEYDSACDAARAAMQPALVGGGKRTSASYLLNCSIALHQSTQCL